MHELSLAESLFDLVGEHVIPPRELKSVSVLVGSLCGVDSEAFEFALPEVASTLGYGRPEVILEISLATAVCSGCGTTYELPDVYMLCPGCSSMQRRISGGDELTLLSIEIAGD